MIATFGEITTLIANYSSENMVEGDCITGVMPCERVRLCIRMDKPTYDQMVVFNGTTGSFDNNFQIISWATSNFANDPNPAPANFGTTTDNVVNVESCINLQVPDDGSPLYVLSLIHI